MNINKPILSICIPTYNRAKYVLRLLRSIPNWCLNFEVIISDNCSVDDTKELVLNNFNQQIHSGKIKYYENKYNIGIEPNIKKVVDLSTGEYCLIMGSDDYFTDDGLLKIYELISLNRYDLIQYGYYSKQENKLSSILPSSRVEIVGITEKLFTHFNSISDTSLLFTFISSFVFKRRLWKISEINHSEWMGYLYIHSFVMHNSLANNAILLTIDDALIVADNADSNEVNSVVGRYIDVDLKAFMKIDEIFYGNSYKYLSSISNSFKKSYTSKYLLSVALRGGGDYIERNHHNLIKLGYSSFYIYFLKIITRQPIRYVLFRILIFLSYVLKFLKSTVNKNK